MTPMDFGISPWMVSLMWVAEYMYSHVPAYLTTLPVVEVVIAQVAATDSLETAKGLDAISLRRPVQGETR